MFLQYMKTHIKSLILMAFSATALTVVLLVYDVDWRAMAYGYSVCIFVGILLAIWDFNKYKDKHQLLQFLEKEIIETMDNLPRPSDLIEADYQKIIKASFDDRMKLAYEDRRKYDEMVEYYTVWAHQIKTPIAALRLILQTEGENVPAGREILDELFKIEQYVEMVLCFLKLDGDGSDYVIKEYDLDDIIRQAVRKYASQFIRGKNRLIFEESGKRVLTDEKWLLFVIEQILSNALKYTKGGEITIRVEEPLTLVIGDTGIGIAAEDLPRIFERGFTGYNGRLDKKSTGIGLYLCRRITGKMGYRISAESQPGSGTNIKIDLYNKWAEDNLSE